MPLVSVAVPIPGVGLLSYRVPDDWALPPRGARVVVPVGRRAVTGIVIAVDAQGRPEGRHDAAAAGPGETPDAAPAVRRPEAAVKPLIDILDADPFVTPAVVDLALWVAEYYACGPGEALGLAMPPGATIESERWVELTAAGRARRGELAPSLRRAVLDALTPGRAVRVEALASAAARTAPGTLRRPLTIHGVVAALEREGLVTVTRPLGGRAAAFKTVAHATLTAQGLDPILRDPAGGAALTARQREALSILSGAPTGLPQRELAARGVPGDVLRRLAARGLVRLGRARMDRDPFAGGGAAALASADDGTGRVLTGEQEAALGRLSELADQGRFRVVLLHGVTGSGKTELYLRLAARVRERGRGALLLVPEIALTPAVAALFRRRLGDRVAIQHSGLPDGERHDQWHRIRRGEIDVVVGTRSAVFAPLPAPGLIIVDEEHDGSYKQEEAPRYHGRDVAVVRGRQSGALVLLGSATPSLESYHNALTGRYEKLVLARRVLERPLASVRIVDMRPQYAAEGPDVVLSAPLREALSARLDRGEQAIVLLNRRGYAAAIFCRQCGETLDCPNCSVSLTVHQAARRARCHYCNYAMALPRACARCAGPYLEQLGFGTERVEAELRALLPGARVARVDRDTMRRRGAVAALLERFARGELDLLVGTQMIAKGHDFERVTLVCVISADVGLGMADFRAGERTFQLLTQVAGRAGRGDRPGEALVQTIHPGHYSIRHACAQDYPRFFEEEMHFRRAMRYPPVVGLINAVVRARTAGEAMTGAGDLARRLRAGTPAFLVLGPAPAPLGRLRGEHRAQLFLKGSHRPAMREALVQAVAELPELRRRTVIDVDPLTVL